VAPCYNAVWPPIMSYFPALEPPDGGTRLSRWFLFRDGAMLLDSSLGVPEWSRDASVREAGIPGDRAHYLGRQDGVDCWAAELASDAPLPASLAAVPFREAIVRQDDEFFRISAQASELLTWAATHRFCGRCGTKTVPSPGERAAKCPSCGLQAFPRVSPAVIVTVLRGEEILLARANRFATGMYSVLAGFVEVGETLEECAHREILEETGVEVRDLRYFASQSWPFPHSLMVAFIARYSGGEIRIDHRELADARWFRRDALPDLPLKASVARRMIDWYIAGGGKEPL
jgi:NAD+ diphosphatase